MAHAGVKISRQEIGADGVEKCRKAEIDSASRRFPWRSAAAAVAVAWAERRRSLVVIGGNGSCFSRRLLDGAHG